jgi:hypothetical protein
MIPATYPSDSTGAMVVQMIYSTTGLTRWVDYIPVKFVAVGAAGDTYANAGAKSAVESLTGTSWSTFISCYEDPTATKPWSTDIGGYIPISPNTGFFSFAAPLVNSLVALKGTGTPTFTRADATACATHTDFEGVVRVVPANCARFQGARLVRNDVSGKSEDCTTGANTTANVTVATTSLTFTSANAGYWYRSNGQVKAIGSVMVFRALISSTVSRTVMIRASNNSSATNESKVNLSIDIIPKIVSLTLVVSTAPGALLFGIDNRASQGATDIGTTGTITFTNIQIEDVTGQTNQNPSEYVSVGVLAAPYQGAGVDGIQFFSTLNPNQVSGNVVTSGTGAAIKQNQGPELVSNPGGPFVNTTGWTTSAGGTISLSGGTLVVTQGTAASYGQANIGFNTVAGETYLFSGLLVPGTVALSTVVIQWIGTSLGTSTGSFSGYFKATAAFTSLTFAHGVANAIGSTFAISNISVKAVNGGLLGSELVTNGDFSNGTTGWTSLVSTLAVVSGALEITNTTTDFGASYQTLNCSVGATYQVTCTARKGTAATLFVAVGTVPRNSTMGSSSTASATDVPLTFTFVATQAVPVISAYLPNTTGGTTGYIDNISVKQVLVPSTAPVDASGPLGYLSEGSRANIFLNSDLIGTNLATQSITVTAAPWTVSFTGTGTITFSGAFVGSLAGSGASTRVQQTFTPTAGLLTCTVTGTVIKAQAELGSFASTFIPTAATAVTRAADLLTYPSAGNLAVLSPYTLYAEGKTDGIAAAGYDLLLISSNQNYAPYLGLGDFPGGGVWFVSGASGYTPSRIAKTDAQRKLMSKYAAVKSTDVKIVSDGVVGTTGILGVQTAEITTIYVGAAAAGANAVYGTIRNVRAYPTALTSAQLIALTTP